LEVESPNGAISFHTLHFLAVQDNNIEANFLDAMGISPYRPKLKAQLGHVVEGGVAKAAGLMPGDLIVSVDDKPVSTWDAFVEIVRESPEKRLSLSVKRGDVITEIALRPMAVTEGGRTLGKIGASPLIDEDQVSRFRTIVKYPIGEALLKAVGKTWETSIFSLKMLGKMLIGEVSWKNLSGPITIADYAGQSAQLGWMSYLTFLALISISLGVLNLLPVPLLDGGHLMYYMAEIIKGSPVSEQAMEIGSRIGFALLLGLMAFAFYNDINRLLTS
jgi:regulator of sigma E protease